MSKRHRVKGTVVIMASTSSSRYTSDATESRFTKKDGNTTPRAFDAKLLITPRVVTRATIEGLNHTLASLEGEFIMKILPTAANSEPSSVNAKLNEMSVRAQTPKIIKIEPMPH
jgi:hypothetical protein